MEDAMRTLGQRIVWAARMAAALHLSEQLVVTTRPRESVGGAGRSLSTDGEQPMAGDCAPQSPFAERRAG
jgi:hypothetical protein